MLMVERTKEGEQCSYTQKNNGAAGYPGPVKIELRTGAGLLAK